MGLKIIWRNPQPVRHIQRWESVERAQDRSVYVVQQFVLDGEGGNGYWTTECELQVIRGGTAA
ncbi:MAG TPA: hypothetical protein VGR48_06665 [Terriglobales bacterium]|nr:hypothetical protein [Terriglobales bacterium]